MIKRMKAGERTGGTVCLVPIAGKNIGLGQRSGLDSLWTEMQHDSRDWEAVGRMWNGLSARKGAVPGVRVALYR